MTCKLTAVLAAAFLAAACSSDGGDGTSLGVVRQVNFTSEAAQFQSGDSVSVLQSHQVGQPQAISLDAGQLVVTPASGAAITVAIPARGEEQALIAGARGHPAGSMPGAVSIVLEDTLPFPKVTINYVATSTAAANVDIYAALAGAPLGQAAIASAVNEVSFPLDAGVWQLVVRRAGTTEVIYRNPAVQINTREPAAFFLVPVAAGGFEGVLVALDRTQTYPDVR